MRMRTRICVLNACVCYKVLQRFHGQRCQTWSCTMCGSSPNIRHVNYISQDTDTHLRATRSKVWQVRDPSRLWRVQHAMATCLCQMLLLHQGLRWDVQDAGCRHGPRTVGNHADGTAPSTHWNFLLLLALLPSASPWSFSRVPSTCSEVEPEP
jgi:hypothetical protein